MISCLEEVWWWFHDCCYGWQQTEVYKVYPQQSKPQPTTNPVFDGWVDLTDNDGL